MAFDDTKRIQLGSAPNDGNGETLRSAGGKINSNFEELYGLIGAGGGVTLVNSIIPGNGISVDVSSGDVTVTNTAPYVNSFTAVAVLGQPSVLASSNQVLTLVAGNNITLTNNGSNITIAAATQQQSNWNAVSGPTAIANKPSIPAAQIQSDWDQTNTSALDYVKNKPTDLMNFTDTTNLLGRESYITTTQTTLAVNPSASVVVWAGAVAPTTVAIKATVIVYGPRGTMDIQTHACEMMIVRLLPETGLSTVEPTVYGTVYTGGSPLASFAAQWNSTTDSVEIVATNLSAVSGDVLRAKVVATQFL
jgi:hypothetical protein